MKNHVPALIIALFLLSIAATVSAEAFPNSDSDLFLADMGADFICPTTLTRRAPHLCPAYSRGARTTRLEYLRARLPDPLPQLAVEEIEVPEGAVTEYSFAYVRPLPAATYRHPEEAVVGLPPVRQFLAGDNWISVLGEVEYDGEIWYEFNKGEFIKAEHVAFTNPSRYHGVALSEQPAYPFGWINRNVNPAAEPGGAPRDDISLRRYERITLFAQELVGDKLWYMVGADQWVEQSFTSRVDVDPRPSEIGPGEKWLEVNTYEATLAAYEGERMVFATLVSTGRSNTWTPNGLTRIWGKLPTTPMQNRDVGPDNLAWYYLEDVQWTQYFNGAYALHAAYWHDAFGFTRSHGCINLSLLDAKWLFEWTTPYTPEDVTIVYSSDTAGAGTWVWVHKTSPFPGGE